MRSLDAIEKSFLSGRTSDFNVGDTVDVHVRIIEGDKERVQIFSGIVIGKKHGGTSETFTVRRIVQGEGVERIFPVHSPRIVKIEVKKRGKVRRAKLHYLRERVGRGQKVEELLGDKGGRKDEAAPAAEAKPEPKAEPAPKPEPAPK